MSFFVTDDRIDVGVGANESSCSFYKLHLKLHKELCVKSLNWVISSWATDKFVDICFEKHSTISFGVKYIFKEKL